jgi:inward rectifier potassium channel
MRQRVRSELYHGQGYDIRVIGGRAYGVHDLYHLFLRASWPVAFGVIVLSFLALNAVFAGLYVLVGGVAHAQPGSFLDAFFFSVQTMGTIGYGNMYPESHAANALVVIEAVIGLGTMAVSTGLVFARFAITRARFQFSTRVAIGPIDGVPHLMLRVGNDRPNSNIVDASFRLGLMRTFRTTEGVTVYRSVDLGLVREGAPFLQRSWMVLHRIDAVSPLFRQTPASLAAADSELTLAVTGIDETSLQPVHARHTWLAQELVFGARLADVISETPDAMILDLRRFHDIEPTRPAPDFPFPEPGP